MPLYTCTADIADGPRAFCVGADYYADRDGRRYFFVEGGRCVCHVSLASLLSMTETTPDDAAREIARSGGADLSLAEV